MEKLNNWLTLIANVGVIAGILFLGLEINQNTVTLRLNAVMDVSKASTELSLSVAHSEFIPAILNKVGAGEHLSGEEEIRLNLYRIGVLRNFESYFFQWRAGYIQDDLFASRRNGFQSFLDSESARSWWERSRSFYSEEFGQYVTLEVLTGAN
jgi:hypothetical protein